MSELDALKELESALSVAPATITLFFRDDDGGWANQRLASLLTLFTQSSVPLDVAVIPTALDAECVSLLQDVAGSHDSPVQLHQHGFSHANHQASGRACEFGSDRSAREQHEDISRGQDILQDKFGDRITPIFTPPWNRCVQTTVDALEKLQFQALSRIERSDPLETRLQEIPVSIDWLKKKDGQPLETKTIINQAADRIRDGANTLGVMLHHQHMDAANRGRLLQFINVCKSSGKARFTSMQSLCTHPLTDSVQC